MASRTRWRKRLAIPAFVFLVVLAAAVLVGLARQHPTSPPFVAPPLAAPSAEPARNYPPPPTRLTMPTNPRFLFIGDSWGGSTGASDVQHGFAWLVTEAFGSKTIDLRGVGGTGYTTAGPTGAGTYAKRISDVPATARFTPNVVVLQGSNNDAALGAYLFEDAVKAVNETRQEFPTATVLMVGPDSPGPLLDGQVRFNDEVLRQAAGATKVPYLSPFTEHWIPVARRSELIGTRVLSHPNDAGYALFAQRMVADMRRMSS